MDYILCTYIRLFFFHFSNLETFCFRLKVLVRFMTSIGIQRCLFVYSLCLFMFDLCSTHTSSLTNTSHLTLYPTHKCADLYLLHIPSSYRAHRHRLWDDGFAYMRLPRASYLVHLSLNRHREHGNSNDFVGAHASIFRDVNLWATPLFIMTHYHTHHRNRQLFCLPYRILWLDGIS